VRRNREGPSRFRRALSQHSELPLRLLYYTARRILLLIPVLIGVSILVFMLVRVLPGDPIRTIVPETATEADIAAARQRFGLDKPLAVQYWIYMKGVLHGDFGTSFQTTHPVSEEMREKLPATLELTTTALAIALVLAIGLGLLSAVRAGKLPDHASRVLALVGTSLPEFWLGILLIFLFYYLWGLAPPPSGRLAQGVVLQHVTGFEVLDALITGNAKALWSALSHLALPAATLVVVITGPLTRSVRAAALDVLDSNAYRCAVAHGITGWRRWQSYLARPSLAGLPTLAALVYGTLLGGAIMIEYVFSWQGFGQWALRGLIYRDYPVIQAFVLVVATFYVVVFLLADILHALLDPRIKL
jgi:peptide/nickel transport system permease protein